MVGGSLPPAAAGSSARGPALAGRSAAGAGVNFNCQAPEWYPPHEGSVSALRIPGLRRPGSRGGGFHGDGASQEDSEPDEDDFVGRDRPWWAEDYNEQEHSSKQGADRPVPESVRTLWRATPEGRQRIVQAFGKAGAAAARKRAC